MASSPITSWQIDGETMETVRVFNILGSKITTDGDCSPQISFWKKIYEMPRQSIKKQKQHFSDKGLYNQGCGFSSSYVWMWELDHKGGWEPKNWCFQIVLLEESLKSALASKD